MNATLSLDLKKLLDPKFRAELYKWLQETHWEKQGNVDTGWIKVFPVGTIPHAMEQVIITDLSAAASRCGITQLDYLLQLGDNRAKAGTLHLG